MKEFVYAVEETYTDIYLIIDYNTCKVRLRNILILLFDTRHTYPFKKYPFNDNINYELYKKNVLMITKTHSGNVYMRLSMKISERYSKSI